VGKNESRRGGKPLDKINFLRGGNHGYQKEKQFNPRSALITSKRRRREALKEGGGGVAILS